MWVGPHHFGVRLGRSVSNGVCHLKSSNPLTLTHLAVWLVTWVEVRKEAGFELLSQLFVNLLHNYFCHCSYEQLNETLWTSSGETVSHCLNKWHVFSIFKPLLCLQQLFTPPLAVWNSCEHFELQMCSDNTSYHWASFYKYPSQQRLKKTSWVDLQTEVNPTSCFCTLQAQWA